MRQSVRAGRAGILAGVGACRTNTTPRICTGARSPACHRRPIPRAITTAPPTGPVGFQKSAWACNLQRSVARHDRGHGSTQRDHGQYRALGIRRHQRRNPDVPVCSTFAMRRRPMWLVDVLAPEPGTCARPIRRSRYALGRRDVRDRLVGCRLVRSTWQKRSLTLSRRSLARSPRVGDPGRVSAAAAVHPARCPQIRGAGGLR